MYFWNNSWKSSNSLVSGTGGWPSKPSGRYCGTVLSHSCPANHPPFPLAHQPTSLYTKPPTHHSTHQPFHQPTNPLANPPTHQLQNPQTPKPTSLFANPPTPKPQNPPTSQPAHQPTNTFHNLSFFCGDKKLASSAAKSETTNSLENITRCCDQKCLEKQEELQRVPSRQYRYSNLFQEILK